MLLRSLLLVAAFLCVSVQGWTELELVPQWVRDDADKIIAAAMAEPTKGGCLSLLLCSCC